MSSTTNTRPAARSKGKATSKASAKRRRVLPAPRMPMWRVTIAAHDVPPRWYVPARVVELGSYTAGGARDQALRWAHIDAGVPALRSLLRLSVEHARVEPMPVVYGRATCSDAFSEEAPCQV